MAERSAQALELVLAFAERTGLTSDRPPERYLWTDAFGVCNLLELGQLDLAERLIDQVHGVLGRHRGDDERTGSLSGLPEEEAEGRPTSGGLRIGKKLPETRPGEPRDERLEWERDGQYFHYLTKWMHALDQVARRTGQARYNVWARELADVAHRAFTYFDPVGRGGRRMYWKMSVDLSRPLVASTGHHDPLDGYVTCLQLDTTAASLGAAGHGPALVEAAADFRAMIPTHLASADPLAIGGLLADAARLAQLSATGAAVEDGLADGLVEAAEEGLLAYATGNELELPAGYRLAFRELGLAIGLAGLRFLGGAADALWEFTDLASEVRRFWLEPGNRRASTWQEHRDINEVMLATAVEPDGFLRLGT